MNIIKQFYLPMRQTFITIIICVVLLAGVNLIYAAWTGPPPGAPPDCPIDYPGCAAPINVSTTAQTFIGSKILNVKTDGTGSLGINGALTVNGLGIFNSNVGIGTASPGYKLDVNGAAQLGQTRFSNSDIYFTNTTHNHTGIGNTAGYAAIENAANYNTLMILGRSGGIGEKRSVSIWDRLDVNGALCINGVCQSSWPSGLGGGGTINYVSKFTGSGTLGNSQIYDNGTNVGIGTAAPAQKLHVAGNLQVDGAIVSPEGTLRDDGGGWVRTYGNAGWYSQTYGGGWFMIDSTWIRSYGSKSIYQNAGILRTDGTFQVGPNGDRFIVNTAGNVGIGTASPGTNKLQVNGKIQAIGGDICTDQGGGKCLSTAGGGITCSGSCSSGNIPKFTGASSVANSQIYDNGISVGIGTTGPLSEKLEVNGTVKALSFLYGSDISLKTDITPITNALDKITSLNGVSFKWKEDGIVGIGLIAQEVESVFPELVKTDPNSGLKSLQYGNLVAPLIEAIKEQQKEIETLKNEIEELKK